MRGYTANTDFKADKPFLYPAPRSFKPSENLKEFVKWSEGSQYEAGDKFSDKLTEFNINAVDHTLETNTTVYRTAEWMVSLRGDRQERVKVNKA